MKIFAVIHNYRSDDSVDSPFGEGEPSWYEMADSSVVRSGNPFFVPDFDERFEAFPSIVYRIGRLGKSIAPRFASRYIDAVGVASAVVAVPLLKSLREAGMPWTSAVSFDRSCLLGNLQPIETFTNNKVIHTTCGNEVVNYDIDKLQCPVNELIARISRDNTLKNGDLILAGLASCGFFLQPGMKLEAKIESINTNLLDINIR